MNTNDTNRQKAHAMIDHIFKEGRLPKNTFYDRQVGPMQDPVCTLVGASSLERLRRQAALAGNVGKKAVERLRERF